MAVSLRLHICLLLLSTSFLNLITCHHPGKDHVPLFIFGDSYLDAGNNNYFNTTAKANFYPYGETFFNYSTGRFSNGRLISDFVAAYADLLFLPPYLQGNKQYTYGVNFASGGAGALYGTFRNLYRPKDLHTQLGYFKDMKKQLRQKLGDAETKTLLSIAVYLLKIGTNDYFAALDPQSTPLKTYTKEEYVGMVIGNITQFIKGVYKEGGRKFGLLNVGRVGCIPLIIEAFSLSNGSCVEEGMELAKLHNKAFPLALHALESQLEGFKYAIHDTFTSIIERRNNPSKYGFKEGKSACCGSGLYRGIMSCGGKAGTSYELCPNPNDYLFFDSVHLTEKAYHQISELFWSGSPNVNAPYNLSALFK